MTIIAIWTERDDCINHGGFSWEMIALEEQHVILSREGFPNHRVLLSDLLPMAREKVLHYFERTA